MVERTQTTENERWHKGCETGVRATLQVLERLGAICTDQLPTLLTNNHTLAGYCYEYALEMVDGEDGTNA